MSEKVQSPFVEFIKKWAIAIRPFALPASTMPVVFGTMMAVVIAGVPLKIFYFILALLGMVTLHSGANIIGDISDYERGLDKVPTPVSGALVRGLIGPGEAWGAAILLLGFGSLMGIILAILVSEIIFILGLIGIAVGLFYTRGGLLALKYHALGDLAVFLNFGIFGALGAWIVQTGTFSWLPVIWAIPIGLLVSGILHANNWRDIDSDREGKIHTLAMLLGDKGSLIYYFLLIFVPFLLLIIYIVLPRLLPGSIPAMPYFFLIGLLALPKALGLWTKAKNRHQPKQPMDFIALDGATAQLNLIFGLLCTIALVVELLVK